MTEATAQKTNSVDDVIAQARAAAEAKRQQGGDLTVQNGGLPANAAPARPMTLDDLSGSAMNVDTFLKVNEHGLEIKAKDTPVSGLIESVVVSIDVKKGIQVFEGIKYGNPAVYAKTYDNARAVSGGSWADAVRKAQLADPKASTYMGADITMTLEADAVTMKGEVAAKAGSSLGHSTSTTNKIAFKKLVDDITAAGLREGVVLVKITAERRTNKAGNVWGILNFELLGEKPE